MHFEFPKGVKTTVRVAPQSGYRRDRATPDLLKEIAYKLGYTHNNQGTTGKLLDAIAQDDIILTVIRTKLSKEVRNQNSEVRNSE